MSKRSKRQRQFVPKSGGVPETVLAESLAQSIKATTIRRVAFSLIVLAVTSAAAFYFINRKACGSTPVPTKEGQVANKQCNQDEDCPSLTTCDTQTGFCVPVAYASHSMHEVLSRDEEGEFVRPVSIDKE